MSIAREEKAMEIPVIERSIPDGDTGNPTYSGTVLLADGELAEIRSLRQGDRAEVRRLHETASDETIRRRFFVMNRGLAARFVDHIFDVSAPGWSLVALLDTRVVGVVTAEPIDTYHAEVALIVDETMHGRGVGTLLLEHMAAFSADRGITTFDADVLMENTPMLRVFHDAGFELAQKRDHDVVTLSMEVRATSLSVDATDHRERQAERRSLSHLFEPTSVAVLGVSRSRGGIGREVVENIIVGGYTGDVYAMGQPGLTIPGVVSCFGLDDIPSQLDLVVVAMPAPKVLEAVRVAAERKAHTCVILTSGLGEAGSAGQETEQELVAVARLHGMRLVGPNCFGVLSSLRESRLNATFGDQLPLAGGLALGSQSGGVGIAILDAARQRDLGLGCFVSLGNKADVSGNDLLSAWTDDEDIHAAALYLESFGNPRKFARIAAAFSRKKPLLAVFGGSSVAGHRGGTSHTAASATPGRALKALFRAAGVIQVDGIADMVSTASFMLEQPLPAGSRLAIVGNAGGLGILAADAASRLGLVVPELSDQMQTELARAVPEAAGMSNPIDLGAGATAASFSETLRLLLASSEVDAILVVAAATAITDLEGVTAAVERIVAANHTKPCLSVVAGGRHPATHEATTQFSSVEDATRSLASAARYVAWLESDRRSEPLPQPRPKIDAAACVTLPASVSEFGWLDAAQAAHLLAAYDIGSARSSVVSTQDNAVFAAHDFGFPVVVKIAAPDVVHKTEKMMVRTGLLDDHAVRAAVRDIQAAAEGPRDVLVQEQLAGPEIAVGLVRDERFGPLVMVASGGVNLELWDDQVFLMPPCSEANVLDALRSLRTWPLLQGFRGSTPVDLEALCRLIQAIGSLSLEHPEVRELDLNPVIVSDKGAVCVDAKVRVRARG